jgi:hypothetical protein
LLVLLLELLLLVVLLLLPLEFLLLRPRRRLVRCRARQLQRRGHAIINGQRMALVLRLRMQGRRITRVARKMVDDLRLRLGRGSGLYRRRWRRSGLFRVHDKARPPHRGQSDEDANWAKVTGTSHGVSPDQAGLDGDP